MSRRSNRWQQPYRKIIRQKSALERKLFDLLGPDPEKVAKTAVEVENLKKKLEAAK